MSQFIIEGGKKLNGKITVNSSKNATVAILIASLINQGQTILKNVPAIEEVNRLIEVLSSIGVKIMKDKRNLIIQPPQKFNLDKIHIKAAQRTRTIILAIGALSGQLKSFNIPQAGGCKLGSRTVKPHLFALENFGIKIQTKSNKYVVKASKLKSANFVLYESGDTVTENALLAAAQIPTQTTIKMATANYMVQDLCFFLEQLGIKIEGIGTTTLKITGKKTINKKITYTISEDPIEAMLFLTTAITTNSSLTIKRCPIEFLELELLKLQKMGFKYTILKKYKAANNKTRLVDIKTKVSTLCALQDKIHALPFPGLNQDNLPFFIPIAMMAKGTTFIHDWAYENRAVYYTELNKLGANINLIDNHRVTITGPTKLKSTEIICPPALRPAAIIIPAMLATSGKSILRSVYPIHRGYERLEERLRKIGANIKLITE